jgi:hypothetical protein
VLPQAGVQAHAQSEEDAELRVVKPLDKASRIDKAMLTVQFTHVFFFFPCPLQLDP